MVLRLKAWESRSPPGLPGVPEDFLLYDFASRLRALAHSGDAGWSSPVARQAHNLKVIGSNPIPAPKIGRSFPDEDRPGVPAPDHRQRAPCRISLGWMLLKLETAHWEHTLKVEAMAPVSAGILYPRLLHAQGCCPPEDIGGPRGYADYLEATADPSHARHDECLQWRGPGFDPNVVDTAVLAADVLTLARKWSGRSARKRA